MNYQIAVAKGKTEQVLLGRMANRHGLIAGATGTGKTVTLKVLAEGFSRIGVPVFLADVKGDLAGLSQVGTNSPVIEERVKMVDLPPLQFRGFPVTFWDVFGESGHPIRATVSEMGPLLLSRLMNLNDTQTGVLSIVFRIADDQGMLLLDLKDLKAMVQHVGDSAKSFTTQYGNISTASIGAIQRGLLLLEDQGAESFFGEPALNIADLMQTDSSGAGVINILAAEKLLQNPKVYSTFLLWLLSELFEQLPEAGDVEKPRLVFFFDEAHLLFDDAPDALLEKIEQVVRLIRSKGVGIYFVTQNPLDIPDKVLGQLGNRAQHALRAFTAKDQKAVRAAAETFRVDDGLDVEAAITELAIGEALISFLDAKGSPSTVSRAFVYPPVSRIGSISPEERKGAIRANVLYGHYEQVQDRTSAYEMLRSKTEAPPLESDAHVPPPPIPPPVKAGKAPETSAVSKQVQAFLTSAARSIGTQVGRQLMRGVLGSITGGARRR